MKSRVPPFLRRTPMVMTVLAALLAPGPAPVMARETTAPPAPAAAPAAAHVVRVYYFHGNARCVSCRKIEALAAEAVRGAFPGELKEGKVEWRVVNVDEPANRRFIKEYGLYTKSIVIADLVNGAQVRYKNLERIWELLREDEAFRQYVRDEVRSYLEKRS